MQTKTEVHFSESGTRQPLHIYRGSPNPSLVHAFNMTSTKLISMRHDRTLKTTENAL